MGTLTEATHRRRAIRVVEDVGALRRAVRAAAAGLAGLRPGQAELVATELATNLLRHANDGGYVLWRPAGDGMELLAVDHGPGMRPSDLLPRSTAPATGEHAAQAPGPGTGTGLGVGLSAVERIASTFDCYSTPGGTVVLARVGVTEPAAAGWVRWGGVNVPLGGDGDSGDGWALAADRGLAAAVLVDGLGHGTAAAVAARAAIAVFHERPVADLGNYLRRAHEAMRATRGGVIGACVIDPARDELTYAGIGNISGRALVGRDSQSLLGQDGTLGTQLSPPARIRVNSYRWGRGATLVLTTDGIRAHWDPPAQAPGLFEHDPALVAAVIHRDHGRATDDAAALVVRDVRGADS